MPEDAIAQVGFPAEVFWQRKRKDDHEFSA
jgi:hypothetical protein